jgi:replicative DNA helicase
VAIFSMEMPGTQLAMRFLSSVGRLDQHRVRTGRLNDDEWQRMTFALGKLHEAPIHIDETPAPQFHRAARPRAAAATASAASSA